MDRTQGYIESNKERFLNELLDLLRIPSISADPAYKADVNKTAEVLADNLKNSAAENVEICPTAGYPIVYGEKIFDASLPTVLVYGHYDVQPPDPLELWTSPPFEPVIRDGRIFARGATDDKGQLFTHLKSIQAWIETEGRLPVNVKFLVEGEEEHEDLFLSEEGDLVPSNNGWSHRLLKENKINYKGNGRIRCSEKVICDW